MTAVEGPSRRQEIRLSNVYATGWVCEGSEGAPLAEFLRLGRLSEFYDSAASHMPLVLGRVTVPGEEIRPARSTGPARIVTGTGWLFLLPSGQVVAAFTLDVNCELRQTIDLLEDAYYGTVTVQGHSLADFFFAIGRGRLRSPVQTIRLLPERHQIALASADEQTAVPTDYLVQQVIYRSTLPYRREFSSINYPPELNRRPTTLGAVGPYVSVVVGHQDYLENAVFLSAVQTVAAAAKLRETHDFAYRAVRSFRQTQDWTATTENRRRRLGQLAERLSDLELELSFSVEAVSDFGLLVRSLRAESYHNTLYGCMMLGDRATTVARMLERLERSIAAELTSVESLERRADEQRRFRWTAAVGFLTTTAAPLGLLFAFLGINATQVDVQASMIDPRYLWVYVSLLILVLAGGLLFVTLLLRERRETEQETGRAHARRASIAGQVQPPEPATDSSPIRSP